jgi:pimeloyl-ACP methyl ester carboxylesterase
LAIDALGHGRSDGTVSRQELHDLPRRLHESGEHPEVDAAIAYLKAHPARQRGHVIVVEKEGRQHVRPIERIALIGHSRGGWAAANVGFRRDDIDCVVSIGAAAATCDAQRPHNFLILTGGGEELATVARCVDAMHLATNGRLSAPSEPFGEFWSGNARRVLRVSGATHFSELASPAISRNVVQWVGSAFDIDAGEVQGHLLGRAIIGVMLALGGWFITATWMASRVGASASTWNPPPPSRVRAIIVFLSPIAASLIIAFAMRTIDIGPVYNAVPAVALITVIAVVCEVGVRLGGFKARRVDEPTAVPNHGVFLTAAMLVIAALGIGVPLHLSWFDLIPTGRRIALVAAMIALCAPGCILLAVGMSRHTASVVDSLRARVTSGSMWMALGVLVWFAYAWFVAWFCPMFVVPAALVAASFLVPLPLWFIPTSRASTTSRGLCHAVTLGWLLGCHLPFVHS